ncbi:pilus assembly protein PilZ [Methylobacterium iners]|uniref:Pilus assembly protein PilZ n=1 Tax=Methylobacterium iners TaxID=418707 RepID=A0ABQ4RZH2_9HYPH|nr:pilus assembly protein PilZ [Methylobacterium iners]GJD96246.1 hypothetical protein OCOJLMKI_3466 [Methylobacterium iners]
MDANLRKFPRQNAFKIGVIRIDNCSPDIECLIWDDSEAGARIEPIGEDAVPDEFELFLDDLQARRSCRVIWRQGRKIGVVFTV